MHIFLLPIWLLALPVTWRRSAKLSKRYRIALLICLTIGLFALGQALNWWIIAGKLSSIETASTIHDAAVLRIYSWSALAASIIFFGAFLLISIHGSRRASDQTDLTRRSS